MPPPEPPTRFSPPAEGNALGSFALPLKKRKALTKKKLSAYIAGALKKPLPKEVAERAKLHLLDTLAAMVSGSRLVPGKRAIGYVKTLGGTKEACVIGTRIVTTAVNAALANGMFGHADETDDSHRASITHPGASVVPAALALAERNRHNGTALLRAMVLGYDVGARLTMSLDLKAFYARGHHPPSFGGLFGAAARGGRIGTARSRARALHALLHRATGRGAVMPVPRPGARRKSVRHGRHARAQRRAGGAARGARIHRRGGCFSGDRNFFFAFSPDAKSDESSRASSARLTRS